MFEQSQTNHRKNSFAWKIIAFLVVIILALCGVIARDEINTRKIESDFYSGHEIEEYDVSDKIHVTSAFLGSIAKPAMKLTTYEYQYSYVDTYERNEKGLFGITVPFSTDKTLCVFSGELGLCIDAENVFFDVDDRKKIIRIKYPDLKIQYNSLSDDFDSYDLKKALLSKSSLKDYRDFEGSVLKKVEERVMSDEDLLKKAKTHTEAAMEHILTASGQINDYTIIHEW